MATKAFTVYGEIALKGARDVKKELAEATTAGQKFNAVVSSPAVRAAAAAAAAAVVAFGAASVRAFINAEPSATRLAAAVRGAKDDYESLAGVLDGTVSDAMRRTMYDDEDLQDALATLTQMTGSTETAMTDLAMVTDLARGKKMNLAAAAELVGKIESGNTAVAKKAGIILGENATKEEYLAAIRQKYAGQAEAYANTLKGSLEGVAVATENIKESFGEGLVGDSAADVQELTDVLVDLAPTMKSVGEGLHYIAVNTTDFFYQATAAAQRFAEGSDTAASMIYDAWLGSGTSATVSLREFEDAVNDGTIKVDGLNVATGGAAGPTGALAGATGDYGDEAGEAAAETDALTRAMDGAMVAADSLAGKTRTLTDLDIANRTAQLDLSGARQRLNDVMADSESTADDVARAQLGVESAELRAADAAADMEAAVKTALSEDYPNDGSIQSANEVIERINAASLAASHFRTGLQTALNEGYTGRGEVRGPQARHGGGAVTQSGMYSLQAGEMVLRETQVERLIDNGGSVTQSAQVVIIADPRYTDMAKLDADVARINSGDVSVGAMLGLMGMTG